MNNEIESKEEMNSKPVAPSTTNGLQAIENKLSTSSIPVVDTQPENINVVQESEPVECKATSEIQQTAQITQQEQSEMPKTGEFVQTPSEAIQQPEAIKDETIMVAGLPAPVTPEVVLEHVAETPQQEVNEIAETSQQVTQELESIKPEITKCEITTTLVITTPKTAPTKVKKQVVETVLQRAKVPASSTFKTWPSRSFDLPGGKPSTVYHENGTTIVTATGYHEAPGFKSEDIDKLRNEPAEDINKMVKESFRCQLGFIKAYLQNLREHPELPW
ncbi:MAG: hypothetical protein FIB07_17965 [Candidatus Methanoperedens sp.]|nr:hypothetical protein [Candidatus Methanoperedens sp.]